MIAWNNIEQSKVSQKKELGGFGLTVYYYKYKLRICIRSCAITITDTLVFTVFEFLFGTD